MELLRYRHEEGFLLKNRTLIYLGAGASHGIFVEIREYLKELISTL